MQKRIRKGIDMRKIYAFDGKKRFIDNFDEASSPLLFGRNYGAYPSEEEPPQENETEDEKQIEN